MNKWIKLSTLLTRPGMLSRCQQQQQDGEKKCCEINWAKIRRKNKHYDTPDWKKDPVGCIPDRQHQLLRMSPRVRIYLKGKYWGWETMKWSKNLTKIMEMSIPSPPQKRKYIYAPEWKQCDTIQNCLSHPTTLWWAILNIIGTWRGASEHKTVDFRPDPTQTGAHRGSNSSENPIPTPFFLTCHGSRICHLDGIGMWCERGSLWAGTARTGREGRVRDGGGWAEREAGTAVLCLTWSQTTVSSQSPWSQLVDTASREPGPHGWAPACTRAGYSCRIYPGTGATPVNSKT